MASSVEFVRIAGYPVKVTSLTRDDASGEVTLVVITRGSADRHQLNELLAVSPLEFEEPEASPRTVRVEGVDARSVGEGEQVITRFSIRLARADSGRYGAETGTSEPRSTDDRLDAIERKIDHVLAVLKGREADRP